MHCNLYRRSLHIHCGMYFTRNLYQCRSAACRILRIIPSSSTLDRSFLRSTISNELWRWSNQTTQPIPGPITKRIRRLSEVPPFLLVQDDQPVCSVATHLCQRCFETAVDTAQVAVTLHQAFASPNLVFQSPFLQHREQLCCGVKDLWCFPLELTTTCSKLRAAG